MRLGSPQWFLQALALRNASKLARSRPLSLIRPTANGLVAVFVIASES